MERTGRLMETAFKRKEASSPVMAVPAEASGLLLPVPSPKKKL
jgi:hypothetical protein